MQRNYQDSRWTFVSGSHHLSSPKWHSPVVEQKDCMYCTDWTTETKEGRNRKHNNIFLQTKIHLCQDEIKYKLEWYVTSISVTETLVWNTPLAITVYKENKEACTYYILRFVGWLFPWDLWQTYKTSINLQLCRCRVGCCGRKRNVSEGF